MLQLRSPVGVTAPRGRTVGLGTPSARLPFSTVCRYRKDAGEPEGGKVSELVRPSHSAGGPTAGLVAKTQELLQRFRDTPGDSFTERLSLWFDTRVAENAADATGVTWPNEGMTRLWKFFFKAGTGTTDRYGLAIKMGAVDQRSEEERQQAREYAAAMHVNIDYQERARRVTLGLGLMVASAAVAAVAINQEFACGGYARALVKAGVFLPFMFGCIELVSGATGLWSIALASIWDVDGTGMQQVPSAELDLALRKKVIYTFSVTGLPGLTILGLVWFLLVP